jgi:hypothetical protein
MYNGGMKQMTDTTFFSSLLGDTMKTYSLKNPYTGVELVQCDASELASFLSYFRKLIGVWDIPVKEITVSA